MIRKQLPFAGDEFWDVWPDPEGDVYIKPLSGFGSDVFRVKCGLKAGSAYTPGVHDYRAVVRVVAGTGLFYLYDRAIPYSPGAKFIIDPETAHSFIKVERDTIFIKEVDTFWQRQL